MMKITKINKQQSLIEREDMYINYSIEKIKQNQVSKICVDVFAFDKNPISIQGVFQ